MSLNQFQQHLILLLTFHVLLYQSSVIHHSLREGLISIGKYSIYYNIGFFWFKKVCYYYINFFI